MVRMRLRVTGLSDVPEVATYQLLLQAKKRKAVQRPAPIQSPQNVSRQVNVVPRGCEQALRV
jgi:hypothetical protein